MPHAAKTKKQTRPRVNTAVSAPVSYPIRPQQTGQTSSSSSSAASSGSYSWTAADAAKASRDGAFLTAWPPEEIYYAPQIPPLNQNYQSHQGQGQAQSQGQGQGTQYHQSSTYQPPTAMNQGGGKVA